MEPAALPVPTTRRWQPLRSGLLNLYRYDEQEFRFERGRMLLRGNNGTGKSRVLALQLPFLLDGEIRPERVEPDGDPAKRMEWNLLLGKYPDRLGYTWIELGREDEDGRTRFLTLGCGLHAVHGRGVTHRWFFVTPARVGHDFYLQTSSGQPLTRSRLAEVLEGRGEILTTAEAYRRTVDRALFRLGEHRYAALVNLLIQLRQPQLSRKLDERKLSDALSEALAPLSEQILADVAEAMRGLEHERNELTSLEAAGEGVRVFAREYRRYAQVAARRRARTVRRAQAEYEEAMRRLREAERRRDLARAALQKVDASSQELAVRERGLEAKVEALSSSPQMHRARELDRADLEVAERSREARQAAGELEQAERRLPEVRAVRDRDDRLAAEALRHVEEKSEEAHRCAEPVGLASEHRNAVALLDVAAQTDDANVTAAADLLAEAAAKRKEAAESLRLYNDALDEADRRLGSARREQDLRESALTGAREMLQSASQALENAIDSYLEAHETWRKEIGDVEVPSAEELEADVRDWAERAEGANPLKVAVEEAGREALQRLERGQAETLLRLRALIGEREELAERLARFEAGYEEPPPPPPSRAPDLRTTREGLPLWLLCEFAPDLDDHRRAGLEAALEASGLLDAWVTPGGTLVHPDDHDRVLVDAGSARPKGSHLGEWILAAESPVDPHRPSANVVRRLLEQIGRDEGDGPVWVSTSGRWQVGPLRGAWSKSEAQFLGPRERARHRERRCHELADALQSLDSKLDLERAGLGALERRAGRVRDALAAAPSDGAIVRTGADLATAARQRDECSAHVRQAEAVTIERRAEREAKRDERDLLAADLKLAPWVDDLGGFRESLHRYGIALEGLWPAIRNRIRGRMAADGAAARVAEAEGERERWARRLQECRERAKAAEEHRDALRGAAGADVEQIRARLERTRTELREAREERESLREEHVRVRVEHGDASKDIETETAALTRIEETREHAIHGLVRCAGSGLLQIATPEPSESAAGEWSVTRAVNLARRLEADLQDTPSDDPDWERVQNTCRLQFEELQQNLRKYDYQPSMTIEDDLWLVTVPFRGRSCNVSELGRELDDEIARHQQILTHREKEIIQNHLIGEVAHHLHERIRDGEELVREMNAELESRPMSTGMRLRFTWRPVEDGPVGLPEARKRLLASSSTWSEADRESLGDFLTEQIQRVREANLAGTWQEHLVEALDYRRWHFFGVERQQEGRWQRLTRRTHGTGSGGEKAIALTIPQFAAAAAHYRTADADAPRLILLDEAFVGVDSDMRGKCMGLLAAFDLDFVMTSEREWGCYATVPGLAIYQLSTRPGVDAVGVSRWVWNGHERIRDTAAAPSMRAPGSEDGADERLDAGVANAT